MIRCVSVLLVVSSLLAAPVRAGHAYSVTVIAAPASGDAWPMAINDSGVVRVL
ncbi:MAG: hypothetical protein HYX78_15460 [Armatimonadetes bacterium]|nr:hypothetical protein [Armatimonadota bacterium]